MDAADGQTLVKRTADQNHIQRLLDDGFKPLAAQILASRGVTERSQICPSLDKLPALGDGHAVNAAGMLGKAVSDGKKICIVGDHDADGMCATAMMQLVFAKLGANSMWLLSNSQSETRGFTPAHADQAAAEGAEVLVTVDNGTSAYAGVQAAQRSGMQVVVTDHHLAGEQGPVPADAIANPHLADSGFVPKHISGAVVAMFVLRELVRQLGASIRIGSYIDLAAISTMSDSMPLNEEYNRQIVMAGVKAISSGRCRPALTEILGRYEQCTASDLSFQIAPRLNSAHRMRKPETGVHLLLAEDIGQARDLAATLKKWREQSSLQSRKIARQCNAMLDGGPIDGSIAVYDEAWVLDSFGNIANSLLEEHAVPTAVYGGPAGTMRGSTRSPTGFPVHDVLRDIDQEQPGLLSRWGGHKCAAGFGLAGDPELFAELFKRHCKTRAPGREPTLIDGELSVQELLQGGLEQLASIPWGINFPEPLFLGTFTVLGCSDTASGNGKKLSLQMGDEKFYGWSKHDFLRRNQQTQMLYRLSLDGDGKRRPFIFAQPLPA